MTGACSNTHTFDLLIVYPVISVHISLNLADYSNNTTNRYMNMTDTLITIN